MTVREPTAPPRRIGDAATPQCSQQRFDLRRSSPALRGRIGGFRLAATHDSRVTTAQGRAAFLRRFYSEVDPDGSLDPAERERRAEAAKKAYFARLAYASSQVRARRADVPSATGVGQ